MAIQFPNIDNLRRGEVPTVHDDLAYDLLSQLSQLAQDATALQAQWNEHTRRKSSIQYKTSPTKPVIEKGSLVGYCVTWNDEKGQPYIDGYRDHVAQGSWKRTIRDHQEKMRRTSKGHLVAHLYNHDKNQQIGGVKHLEEDSKGVYYVTSKNGM